MSVEFWGHFQFGMRGGNQGSAPLPPGWGEGFGVFHWGFWECSQIPSQFLYLIQEEVQVLAGDSRIGDNLPEEVDVGSLGLVSHHHGAPPDHLFLDGWGHLGGNTISGGFCFSFWVISGYLEGCWRWEEFGILGSPFPVCPRIAGSSPGPAGWVG